MFTCFDTDVHTQQAIRLGPLSVARPGSRGAALGRKPRLDLRIGRMVEDAEERRSQAIDRATRALARAIVELVEAASMPRDEASPTVVVSPRRPDDALTMAQVCEITSLNRKTFYNMRANGEGPAFFVVRNRLRCYRSDLEEWMSGRQVSNSSQV